MSGHRLDTDYTDSFVRFARFVVAGTGGFVVQVGMLGVLTSLLGVHYLVATLIAVEVAILFNFAWHYRWTWRDRAGSWVDQLIRYNALNAITSIFGSIFLTALFVEVVGLNVVSANMASVAALSVVNFIGAIRLWDLGGVIGAIGMVMTFVITSAKNVRALYLEETRR